MGLMVFFQASARKNSNCLTFSFQANERCSLCYLHSPPCSPFVDVHLSVLALPSLWFGYFFVCIKILRILQ